MSSSATPNGSRDNRQSIDNLIRRELKVGDPRDARQVARALTDRYQSDSRTQAIAGEAEGLPFLRSPQARHSEPPPPTATNVDLAQARSDVNLDLEMLLADNLTKDIRPELEGWQSVIQRTIDEGVAAAGFGLDPHKRDAAFAMRRQLGDYARLSRMIGALTPALNRAFRNLATSLDEASSVILVQLGESIANLGFAGGRFMLQAPYSELQARRDAVLNALRQVDNVAALSGGPGTWPRGLRAYRQLSTVLEARGQGDLRSLMNEVELSRTMDELIQLAGGGAAAGLRAVGATAWAPLNRLQRFVQTTLRQVAPASHELATLHEAMLLFLEGFVPAGGFRLLRVARPTVLNYGLYGSAAITHAERRLIELVNRRGTLARELDCLTQCACDSDTVRSQIVLDKVLYDLDRAIDYYSVGDADLGLPETRAAAFSHLIDAILPATANYPAPNIGGAPPIYPWNPSSGGGALARPAFLAPIADLGAIAELLDAVRSLLRPSANPLSDYPEANWWATTEVQYGAFLTGNLAWLGGAPTPLRFATILHDELCMQRQTDLEWRSVIEQMTSGCVPVLDVFNDVLPSVAAGCLPLVTDRALDYLTQATAGLADPTLRVPLSCVVGEPVMPRHFEDSLDEIVEWLP
jgi:hypothetical protein